MDIDTLGGQELRDKIFARLKIYEGKPVNRPVLVPCIF